METTPDPVADLVRLVARLRAPDGCPWDREQTHESLRSSLLEETHEAVAAIEAGDHDNLREELGDLLFLVVFHAQLAAERGEWSLADVATGVIEKMVHRHPHVFGPDAGRIRDSGAALAQWDEIKRREKPAASASALDGLSRALPTLMHAQKAQAKAARVGFDWPGRDPAPVLDKLREESAELAEALASGDPGRVEDELGDLFFTAVNLARRAGHDAEVCARRATEKFIARFRHAEAALGDRSPDGEPASLDEWDAAWEAAKAAGQAG